MTCEELYGRLTDLAEGTLKGDVCDEVQRHLAECQDCQAVRRDLEDLDRLCRQGSGAPPVMPEGVRRRIQMLLSGTDDEPSRPSA